MSADRLVERIVQLIVQYYAPEEIYLFGSRAKGVADVLSDIDLLVIKDTPLPRRQRGAEVKDLLRHQACKIDLLFVTPRELAVALSQEHSFLRSIWGGAKKIL